MFNLCNPGIWSPGSNSTKSLRQSSPDRVRNGKDESIPPVWTPSSAGPSPVPERKEFRPVPFESPVLGRKKIQVCVPFLFIFTRESFSIVYSELASFYRNSKFHKERFALHTLKILSFFICSNNTSDTVSQPQQQQQQSQQKHQSRENSGGVPSWEPSDDHRKQQTGEFPGSRIVNSYSAPNALSGAPRLPRAQNPTITLLQKARGKYRIYLSSGRIQVLAE